MKPKKKNIGIEEQIERIEAMGQESNTKAAKWVQEVGKEQRAKEEKRISEVEEKLHDSRSSVLTYKDLLIGEMRREMSFWYDDVPLNFHWVVQSTDKGIVLWIKTPKQEYLAKGIKLSGEPKYDLNAIARIIVEAVKEMQKLEPKEDGIVLPYK